MSKTLSVLIVENFIINEGPKWDKFKKGAKKVGYGVAGTALGLSFLLASGGAKNIYNAHTDYVSDMNTNHKEYKEELSDLKWNNWRDIKKIDDDDTTTPETKEYTKSKINDNFSRDWRDINDAYLSRDEKITDRRDNQNTQGKQALAVGAGLGVVPLVAGAHALGVKKGKKEKEEQADKSLKERLELVKSGMFLNEEDADNTVLEKERESDGHTPESIATLHNVPAQDILDQIERGIEIEREHTTDKAEARLIAMDHLVELPDYYTRLDKMEEEGKMENSINESEKKQANKSLKERLNLVKSGMFLNEESADITALRNKISQGLILLPGLKGSAADKMEDSIRSWEDQINELEKKIGEKYE